MNTSLKRVATHTFHMHDFVKHVIVFSVCVLLLGILTFATNTIPLFIAGVAGWGIVLFCQAAYVFLFEHSTMDVEAQDIAVEVSAQEHNIIKSLEAA